MEILADRVINPDYNYIANLFQKYKEEALRSSNRKSMFKRLEVVVKDYNNLGHKKAVLQEYDACVRKSFILYIVTSLMSHVHEKIPQAGELYYMDASASFDSLNTSITFLYTSCMAGVFPLGLFVISDEFEIILEKAVII